MTLEERIFSTLSPLFGERVFPLLAPAGVARPFAVYTPVSTSASYTLAKAGNNDRRLVQVDVYAESYDQCVALAQDARSALEAVHGNLDNEGRAFEPETRLWRARLDIYLWHRPAN